MFTGLVERIGKVRRISRGAGLVIEFEDAKPRPKPLEDGESIAVNGVCLTVAKHLDNRWTADVLRETEERTGIKDLLPGDEVNLERALTSGKPMGGHIVQGHVDCQGKIASLVPCGRDVRMKISCPKVFAAQCVLKGSVAIDGVSLTITELDADSLSVDLIPSTRSETTLGKKKSGQTVNLESDIIGKYVQKSLSTASKPSTSTLTEQMLLNAGFI